MVKLANTTDLKSVGEILESSSLSRGTTKYATDRCCICGRHTATRRKVTPASEIAKYLVCTDCEKETMKASEDSSTKYKDPTMNQSMEREDVVTEEVKELANNQAKRVETNTRFDLLVPEFLNEMARLASFGARKYGDRNWQASRLEGDKSPLNHIYQHLNEYQQETNHDFFQNPKGHLVAVAFNAMMEWWYEQYFPRE